MFNRITLKDGEKLNLVNKRHADCYADENRNACIIGIDGKSQDLRSFIKDIWCRLVNQEEVFPDDDEEFDDFLDIELQDDSSISGLIAYLYQQMHSKAELYDKLADYEDLEERGLLLRLPCKVGDAVWFVKNKFVYEYEVRRLIIDVTGIDTIQVAKTIDGTDYRNRFSIDDIGKTVFLTQAEAEQKLKEMEEK